MATEATGVTEATATGSLITVTVCHSPAPRQVLEAELIVPAGATIEQALAVAPEWAQTAARQGFALSIWGKAARLAEVLQAQDRIEFSRALRVDPKVARRERFAQQGSRAAGLFAKRKR
jgi:putative ubiquitin-RnfH superfamily antitoxin RatB of RatAB toxin-antitoxin module